MRLVYHLPTFHYHRSYFRVPPERLGSEQWEELSQIREIESKANRVHGAIGLCSQCKQAFRTGMIKYYGPGADAYHVCNRRKCITRQEAPLRVNVPQPTSLRKYRERWGLTQRHVAIAYGCRQKRISQIENRKVSQLTIDRYIAAVDAARRAINNEVSEPISSPKQQRYIPNHNLRALRIEAELRLKDIAKIMGVSISRISDIEHRAVRRETIHRYLQALRALGFEPTNAIIGVETRRVHYRPVDETWTL